MKRSITLLSLVSLAAIFFACGTQRPIESKKPKNNKTYKVEYLFEHDGCKVYRFMDNGHYVYFTNCKGDVTSMLNDSTSTRIQTLTNR